MTGSRLVLVGVGINAVLALVKAIAGLVGHSSALVADAIESAGDVAGSLVTWFGIRLAERPADENHPYGHGKYEPLTAMVVAGMLLGAATLIVVESIHHLVTPREAPAPYTLIVLVAVVIVKETMARVVARKARQLGSVAVAGDALHHRADAITSLAAFVGILVAIIGGPGWERADAVAAIVAACVIVVSALRLARPALAELLDEAPSGDLEALVARIAAAEPGVAGTHKCRVRKIGTDLWVDLHVRVAPEMTVHESHALAHRVKDRIRAAEPRIADVLIHVEPAT